MLEILSSQPTPAQCYSSLQCWRYSVPSLHLHSATQLECWRYSVPAYTCSRLQCWRYSVPSLHLHSATLACNAGDNQFPFCTCTMLLQLDMLEILSSPPTPAPHCNAGDNQFSAYTCTVQLKFDYAGDTQFPACTSTIDKPLATVRYLKTLISKVSKCVHKVLLKDDVFGKLVDKLAEHIKISVQAAIADTLRAYTDDSPA
ncbi:hypothetical protein J6590_086428 [Homalodisca vitripennis]|nr:hypothetical protein J6590_086428 [Homalodisca vitripennis]